MNLERLARLRQGIYRLAAAGFARPRSDLGDLGVSSIEVLVGLDLFDYPFGPAWEEVARTLEAADPSQLASAHVELFDRGVGPDACPPFESAHRSEGRPGAEAALYAQLRRDYQTFGLQPATTAITPDHITVELEAMSWLCRIERQQREAGRSVAMTLARQQAFLRDHLVSWIPSFASQLRRADRHPFYSALAAALHAFTTHDHDLVGRLLELEQPEFQT